MQNVDPNNTSGSFSLRQLAPGDFDGFKALFHNAQITLPPTNISEEVLDGDFELDIQKWHCEDVSIGDVIVSYAVESAKRMTVEIEIAQLDFQWHMTFHYSHLAVPDRDGSADIYTGNNQPVIKLAISSPSFAASPPTSVTVESCQANVTVTDIVLHGGFLGS